MRETPAQPCDWCGYDLTGLPANHVCPECGVAAADPAMQSRAEEWFVGRRGRWLIDPPRRVVRFVHTPRCTRVALRRYAAYILIPLLAYAAWLCLWCQFAFATTYTRWWELNSEPGVRRGVDQVQGFSLALGDETWRDRAHLPESSLAPFYEGRFYWEFASTSITWRPHWPRFEFFVAPMLILVAALACKISVYWAIGICATLSTKRVRWAILWRGAWNLSVSQLLAFAAGVGLLALAIPPTAFFGMFGERSSLLVTSFLATLAAATIQLPFAWYMSASIGQACGEHMRRLHWRALCIALLVGFAGSIIVGAACIGYFADRVYYM